MPSTTGKHPQAGVPRPIRGVLRAQNISTLYKLGGDIVAPIPRALVRQLGLERGQLIAWSDVGQGRLLIRRAEVIVHGSGDVRAD